MLRAALDVGSNSVLLIVERFSSDGWKLIEESSEVTGLGVGVKTTGILSEDGMTETLAAIARAFERSRSLGAGDPLAGVTMAARIATNTDDFLARAKAQGTPVFVLSGEDEADLGFQAVAGDPTFTAPRLSIIDIGGQSTELVTADRSADGWIIRFRRSYPIGTLALLGGTLRDECPGFAARLKACEEIDDCIGLAYRPGQGGEAIVLGATGVNLVSIREKLTSWNPEAVHGAHLDYEEISKASAWLAGLTVAERAAIVGIEPGREKTLPIGALMLERFLFALRVHGCRVSTRGWRHALLEEGMPKRT